MFLEALHRLMVHSRRSRVRDHLTASDEQVERRAYLVNQRVPSSSSHSFSERCQHAVSPHAAVRPVLDGPRLSGRGSRERHCGRLFSIACSHSTSTSLRPFAPPALPGFFATMDALTPERRLFVPILTSNEHRPSSAQVSLLHVIEPSDHSISNHRRSSWEFGLVSLPGLPRD